jgi:flagellar protein FlbD
VDQVQTIEIIPESKLIFANKEFLLVKESEDEIINKVVEFNAKIYSCHKYMTISKEDDGLYEETAD